MSVENIEALSPPNGYPERTENTNDATEKVEEGEQGGSPQVASVIPSAMGDELSAPIQSENPIRAQRMEWIDNLSEKELLRMFTLADVPFLASLLAVSSLSSSARGHMDRPSGISAERHSRWLDSVGSSKILAVHGRICDDFKTGKGVLITSRWISSIQASVGESRAMSSEVSKKSLIPDEIIRIRHDHQEGTEMTDIEAFWLILEHARVVFPSAVSFVTGNATANNNSTLLTVSPSILQRLGARKVYDALNAGLQSILPDEKFFSTLSTEDTWVDSLLELESKEHDCSQIPLYAMLLLRLEHAFREAYQASVATSVEGVGSEQLLSDSGEKQSTELAVDSQAFVDALADRLQQLEDSKIEDEERRSITGELAKACGGSDGMSIQLSDLLLSPLTLVCRSMEPGGIGSLAVVDDIIKSALERFKTVSAPKHQKESDDAKSDGKTTSQDQRQNQDNSQQKGKARKKKRRRPKKKQGKCRVTDHGKSENETISDLNVMEKPNAGEEATNDFLIIEAADPISEAYDVDGNIDAPTGHEAKLTTSVNVAEADKIKNSSAKADANVVIPDEVVVTNTPGLSAADGQGTKEDENSTVSQVAAEGHDDGDAWETVEVKPRNQRKKGLDRSNTMSSRTSTGNSSSANDNNSKKSKEKRKPASRKKNTTRKMVREILLGVVDSVDTESVHKQKPVAAPVISENRWKKGPPVSEATKQNSASASSRYDSLPNRSKTLRDIVLGNANGNDTRTPDSAAGSSIPNDPTGRAQEQPAFDGAKKAQGNGEHAKKQQIPDSLKKRPPSNSSDGTKQVYKSPKSHPTDDGVKMIGAEKASQKLTLRSESPSKSTPSKWTKGKPAALADQNTAPTYQETVSAMSGTSNRVSERPTTKANQVEPAKSDTSSGGTDEAPQNRQRTASPVEKESASGPPLLTFVSPENANSATSSVASSLEVPHASRRHHHSTSSPDTADVGYHLLDVCDRLSRDMRLFMSSREQAINSRRRERGAVLTALQDSLSNVWPGMCRPEMYGSCATLLDLPSSDLDVVVVGLDHSEMMIAHEMAAASQQKSKRRDSSNSKHRRSSSKDESIGDEEGSAHPRLAALAPTTHVHHGGYVPSPLYRNSERVRQLAMQIEGKPWAVKVKSLPNASVPVIKILADPSKLPGTVTGSQWPRPLPDGDDQDEPPSAAVSGDVSTSSGHQAPSQNLYEPWRGSDIMNGLISLDITFEGPEHGGLGSTDFSVHVVNEACQEAGGPPESTPFVQCLMVLKELLVQRKLNEPYSGGLSSYALLLLLLALVRERALIRQEIERVECQRQAMANGGVATYAGASSNDSTNPPLRQERDEDATSEANNTPATGSIGSMKHTNSWANIAKKSSNSPTPSISGENPETTSSNQAVKPKLDRPASFADAVVRRSNGTTISDAEGKGGDEQGNRVPGDSSAAASAQMEPVDPNRLGLPSFYPQGFDDVIEVLCTGETTAGKLLMHFLLYYAQYFDAQATAIDISGKHERVFMGHSYSPYSYLSPYIPRRAPETIDPHTGMLVVDHIVIYDPLEGAENNNVARRCFAWQQVKWIFAQSYATLSSAVERSSSPPATPNNGRLAAPVGADKEAASVGQEMTGGDLMDPSSPLLRCLLSF